MLPFCVLLSPRLYAVSHNAVSATHFHVQYQRRTSATAEDFRSVAPVGLHQIQTIPKEPATGMLIRFWWKWNIFRFVWSYRRRKSETALTERRGTVSRAWPGYSLPFGEGRVHGYWLSLLRWTSVFPPPAPVQTSDRDLPDAPVFTLSRAVLSIRVR